MNNRPYYRSMFDLYGKKLPADIWFLGSGYWIVQARSVDAGIVVIHMFTMHTGFTPTQRKFQWIGGELGLEHNLLIQI